MNTCETIEDESLITLKNNQDLYYRLISFLFFGEKSDEESEILDEKINEIKAYFTNAKNILFKIKKTCCPFDERIIYYDISLKKNKMKEDEIFMKNTFLLKKLRRGVTIIECISNENMSKLSIGRKGLEKFFDINYEKICCEKKEKKKKQQKEEEKEPDYSTEGLFTKESIIQEKCLEKDEENEVSDQKNSKIEEVKENNSEKINLNETNIEGKKINFNETNIDEKLKEKEQNEKDFQNTSKEIESSEEKDDNNIKKEKNLKEKNVKETNINEKCKDNMKNEQSSKKNKEKKKEKEESQKQEKEKKKEKENEIKKNKENEKVVESKVKYIIGNQKSDAHSTIFSGVNEAFKEKKKVKIFITQKANGENCQISYCKLSKAWIICSKNVSILVRNEQDTQLYYQEKKTEPAKNQNNASEKESFKKPGKYSEPKNGKEKNKNDEENKKETENEQNKTETEKEFQLMGRYQFAILIARQWFEILEKVKDKEKLKAVLSYHTLIGEYVGNTNFQHLVYYNEINIYFYALVEKNGEETCISPLKFNKFCAYQGLKAVLSEESPPLEDFNSLNLYLTQIFQEISNKTIEEGGEGCVLYFQEEDLDKPEKSKMISLGKIKTLEYRIYRKLREKIKVSLKSPGKKDILLKRMKDEVEDLSENFSPPFPLETYEKIARFAFDLAKNLDKDIVKTKYLEFLNVMLFYYFEKNNDGDFNFGNVRENFDKTLESIRKDNWKIPYINKKVESIIPNK